MKKLLSFTALCLALALSASSCGSTSQDSNSSLSSDEASGYSDSSSDADSSDSPSATSEPDSDSDDLQRVGSNGFGYLEIPVDWQELQPDESENPDSSVLQYCNGDLTQIITLNYTSEPQVDAQTAASSCWSQMEETGASDIRGSTVTLDGCTAYQVYGYYTDTDIMLVLWLFTDEEGLLHYVSAEGPRESVLDAVGIVEDSYSLN